MLREDLASTQVLSCHSLTDAVYLTVLWFRAGPGEGEEVWKEIAWLGVPALECLFDQFRSFTRRAPS